MESETPEPPGENEKFLSGICRRIGARLDVGADGLSATAVVSKEAAAGASGYKISSMPKPTRESACFSVVRQLLFPEVAAAAGVPPASSVDELRLKLEVAGLS